MEARLRELDNSPRQSGPDVATDAALMNGLSAVNSIWVIEGFHQRSWDLVRGWHYKKQKINEVEYLYKEWRKVIFLLIKRPNQGTYLMTLRTFYLKLIHVFNSASHASAAVRGTVYLSQRKSKLSSHWLSIMSRKWIARGRCSERLFRR